MNRYQQNGLKWIFGAGVVIAWMLVESGVVGATTVTLEQAVHFLTPGGDDVLVKEGSYEVEAAEGWLRLVPKGGERSEAVLLAASRSQHKEKVTVPAVMSVRGGEDVIYLRLLTVDGQTRTAKGAYSGVRSRSLGNDVEEDVKLVFGRDYVDHSSCAYPNQSCGPNMDPKNVQRLYPDGDITLDNCLMICEETQQCKAFTWDPGTKHCWILRSRYPPPLPFLNQFGGVADSTRVSGYSTTRFFPAGYQYAAGALFGPPSTGVPQSEVILPKHHQYFEGRGKILDKISLADCQVRCAQAPDCKSFRWEKPPRNRCELMNAIGTLKPKADVIGGEKKRYWDALSQVDQERWTYWTQLHLPKCIQAALQGGAQKWFTLYGQSWWCYPAQVVPVASPQLKSLVLEAKLGAAGKAATQAVGGVGAVDDYYNQVYTALNLSSPPENTHIIIGRLAHNRSIGNDHVTYVYAVWRVSATKIAIHDFTYEFGGGGLLSTPVGWFLETAIKNYLPELTGVPYSGHVAVRLINEIEAIPNAGTAENGSNIATAIGVSAGQILPPMPSTSAPVIGPKFTHPFTRPKPTIPVISPRPTKPATKPTVTSPISTPKVISPVIQPKVTQPSTKLPLSGTSSLGRIGTRGIENFLPPVTPDSEPPALPNTEIQGGTP